MRKFKTESTQNSTPIQTDSAGTPALNILQVILGDRIIKPKYNSKHVEDVVGAGVADRLFVCKRCFKYTPYATIFVGHMKYCTFEVPGRKIYEKGRYSIHEVDGAEETLFAQNLSLFGKFFIESKTVMFDVSGFSYYLLVDNEERSYPDQHENHPTPQVVGFFSKEEVSWDNNNLACIVVFPPWQRKGLGQLLMGASYELSKKEGKLGGPERPLSNQGRQSYVRYWSQAIAVAIFQLDTGDAITIEDLSTTTFILRDDVVSALQHMSLVERNKTGTKLNIDKGALRRWLDQNNLEHTLPVDPDCFIFPDTEEESDT